jgi:hypothetical protein
MEYLLLIYEDEGRFAKGYDPSEMAEYSALGQTFGNIIRGGSALQPTTTARTVQVRNGKPSTNEGPAVKTAHQLTGYYAIDARNVDEALAMAAKLPAARFGSIEVRPIMKFAG